VPSGDCACERRHDIRYVYQSVLLLLTEVIKLFAIDSVHALLGAKLELWFKPTPTISTPQTLTD
jgi:hypothetical protein